MAKKNFLLLSLEDEQAKKVANIVSNDSCRKILDYLAENEATESELSKKLGIPISTVHYNLKQLMKSGLVDVEEFHYSEKGKEVNHYKLANKYIIITPKKVTGIMGKLKNILPIGLITLGIAGVIQFLPKLMPKFGAVQEAAPMLAKRAVEEVEFDVIPVAAEVVRTSFTQYPGLWFLLGAVFVLIVYLIMFWWKNRKLN